MTYFGFSEMPAICGLERERTHFVVHPGVATVVGSQRRPENDRQSSEYTHPVREAFRAEFAFSGDGV